MTKANTTEKQNPVTVKDIDGIKQYTIFINEEEVPNLSFNENEEDTGTHFEYDFNQFYDNTVEENDVKEHPEKYLDYVPKQAVSETKTTTVEDRLSVLEEAVQDIALALMGE